MRSIRTEFKGKNVQLVCAHWRTFPPRAVFHDKTPEELRALKIIDESEYQRGLVWKNVCGLVEMDPAICLKCPHARTAEFRKHLPVLVTLDGSLATPTLDLPSLESSSRHRKFLERIQPPPGKDM
jgi:hypothetical protein